jgi:hypothetical protein
MAFEDVPDEVDDLTPEALDAQFEEAMAREARHDAKLTFDVKMGDTFHPLVRDPTHVHPPELHRHLGTNTTTLSPELAIRRLLNAVEASGWIDDDGVYRGRDAFGIGIVGRD